MLTAAELCLVADEINGQLAGARLVKVNQPEADRLVFRFDRDGEDRLLLVVLHRPFPRVHLITTAPPNPRLPSPACVDLRAALEGARVARVETLPHDRVVVMHMHGRDGAAGTHSRTVHIELFGQHPNLIVSGADRRVLAAATLTEHGPRPVTVGTPYTPPPTPSADLAPIPPFSQLGADLETGSMDDGGLSRALDAWFTPRENAARLEAARTTLDAALGGVAKRTDRLIENLARDIRSVDDIPRIRAEGEALKAMPDASRRGQAEVTVTDWSSGIPVPWHLKLDPAKTPLEEAQARFSEARRLERSIATVSGRHHDAVARRGVIDVLRAKLALVNDIAAVSAIADEARRGGLIKGDVFAPPATRREAVAASAPVQAPRVCYRTFKSKDGLDILVGRTSRDNDELTFQVANGNDFWMHVRNWPGSHVVVRATREHDDLPPETLLDAATLAVHFSKADGQGHQEVSWTRRKFVGKTRGAPAGQVTLSAHKSLRLRPEPARLHRLLGRDPNAPL